MKIHTRNQTKRQQSIRHLSGMVFLFALFLMGYTHTYAQDLSPKIYLEKGTQLPNEGAAWINYEIETGGEAFNGSLIIKKVFNTGSNTGQNESGIETVYPIHLEAGQVKGRVKHTPTANAYQMNFQTLYRIVDGKGSVLKAGSLGFAAYNTKSGVMLVSESLGHWRQVSAMYTVFENPTPDKDADFLKSYKTFAMTHEDALSLNPEVQQLLLNEVSQGARIVVISPKGHIKENFVETLTGVKFSRTGMSNLKQDLNYMLGENQNKDLWLETAKTESGNSMFVTAYGKGSLLELGYDPFASALLSPAEKQQVSEVLWLDQNIDDKYSPDENGFYEAVRKLPYAYAPKFGVMLALVGLFIVLGLGMGLYLGKIKKQPQGMVIGIFGGTIACLLVLVVYSGVRGYTGIMLNSVKIQYTTATGYQMNTAYIGVKGNRDKLILTSEKPMDLSFVNMNWHQSNAFQVQHSYGEKETWAIPRVNKWQVNVLKQTEDSLGETLTGSAKQTASTFSGSSKNPTKATWYNPIILVDGMACLLDTIPAETTFKWQLEQMSGENVRVVASDKSQWHKKLYNVQQFEQNPALSKRISADTVTNMLEAVLLKYPELKRGTHLIAFTQGGKSDIQLSGEKGKSIELGIQIYEMNHMVETATSGQTRVDSSQLLFLESGSVRRDPWSNGISIGSKSMSSQLIALTPPIDTKSKASWQLQYSRAQLETVQLFNFRLGIWEKVSAVDYEIKSSQIDDYLDASGRVSFLLKLKNNYLQPTDLVLRREGAQ